MLTWVMVLGGVAFAVGLFCWLLTESGGGKDPEGEFFHEKGHQRLAELRLAYHDRTGMRTERDVVVFRVHPRLMKFEAYCRMRQEERTFYFTSVEQAVDLLTGEIIPDLGAFFKRR